MLSIGINGRSIFRQLTGVQHYAIEISQALCALQPEDTRFTVFAGREGRSLPETGMPVSSGFFPADGPVRGILWEQALLRRMVRKAGVDVLFNPGNVAPLFPGVTSVVTIHDLAFLLFPGFFSRSFARYYREAIPRIAARAGAIITDSNSTRDDLLNHYALQPGKISVVPLGVSPRFRVRPSGEKLREVRKRYGLPARFFLSISSFEPRKNLRALVKAFRLLSADVLNEYGLVLTGAGGHVFADDGTAAEISKLESGNVITTGYVPADDLIAIYHLAAALVYPSLYEGFGLPVLEAMASSTPVITSDRSALPEVAGHAAILIDPEDTEQLTAAMELIATDSGTRNLLVERGRKRSALYTWEDSAEKTLAVIRSVAD